MNLSTDQLKRELTDTVLYEREPMSAHTTFKTGGPAAVFALPADEADIWRMIRLCRKGGDDFAIIGRGSNLLVSDRGFDGLVICIGERMSGIIINKDGIEAQAGAPLTGVCSAAKKASFTGLEFACGIPGSVGGAVAMNAGAYGGEMKDVIRRVNVMDKEGQLLTLSGADMAFRYRGSRVADEGLIVLSAFFDLPRGNPKEIELRMNELLTARREKQPLEYPSAGSTFKRPEGHYAGALIEQAGLKGHSIGGAQVSEKHAGFIINRGGASSADIMALVRYVQQRVLETSGVTLEPEIRILGEF